MITDPKKRGATKKERTKKPKAARPTGKRMAYGPIAKRIPFGEENRVRATSTWTPPSPGHGQFVTHAIMQRITDMGLITDATKQVGARLPIGLLDRAKERTGLTSNTDLLVFALANLAVEDTFSEAFANARGTVDADLEF